jgi:hypothetical protein
MGKNSSMKKISLLLILPLLFVACRKHQAPPATNLTLDDYLRPGKTDSSEIIGNWELVATKVFRIANPDTSWIPADTIHQRALVVFAADRSFRFNGNYAFINQQYDQYKTNDSADLKIDSARFRLLATHPPTGGNFAIYPSPAVRQLNADALIITYMGVDYTPRELYIRTGPFSN